MTDVSVIVPAYNEERFLPRSLGSLLFSSLGLAALDPSSCAELVVVDNGSVDGTASVARSFGARVIGETSRGVARARNAGARATNGDLLVFVDADYRVPFTFLPGLVQSFRNAPGLTAAGVKVRLEPTEIDPVTHMVTNMGLGALRRLKRMSFGVFAFRRTYFEKIGGFDERSFAYEDVEMLERIACDVRGNRARYQVLTELVVHASARGFYRGGMLSTYLRMAVSRKSRRDIKYCGYWYER